MFAVSSTGLVTLIKVHMAYILLLRDSHAAHEQGWVMLGVANKLAISVSHHATYPDMPLI